jgi:molybdopterin molybdotransferase
MDGYAFRAAEFSPGKSWPVAHRIAAGQSADVTVPPGQCVAIATGAPLPGGLDTVIQHELTDRGDLPGKPVRFAVDSVTVGHAVHHRGSDAKAGQTLIESGTELRAHHLGIAASVGAVSLNVRAKPRVVVLTSGDEVVPPTVSTRRIKPHQIRNSNAPLVNDLLRRLGTQSMGAEHLADESDAKGGGEAVRWNLARCDLLITVGGVSAGERDHFPAAFDACGVVPNGCVVVGLPGNPVSVLACACLFVWPIVRAMLGLNPRLPWREVILAQDAQPNPQRRAFRPAILDSAGGASVPPWAGSGDLAHTAPTHGLVELPVQSEPVPPGTHLRFLPWP